MARRLPRTLWIVAAIVVAGVLAVRAFGAVNRRPTGLLDGLEREGRRNTVAGVRLSIDTRFRPCPAGLVPCGGEAPRLSRRANRIIQRADSAVHASPDASALQVTALANLLFSGAGKNSLDSSVSYLQSAARLSVRPAPVLADLAAAYLMRARETGSAHDLFRGLEAAAEALELEADNLAARFNAAEAMDRIGLREAAAAWARYLAVDSASAWSEYARTRHRTLSIPPARRQPPGPNAGPAEMAAFADTAAKEAREHGWDRLLGWWGAAVLAGDTAAARRNLEQAEAIGAALVRRGGDASLADATAEIRRRTGPALRLLASEHREFSDIREVFERAEHQQACKRFESLETSAESPVLGEWIRTFVSICGVHGSDSLAVALLTELIGQTDEIRHPATVGRQLWTLGIRHQNANRYDAAKAAYRRAEQLFLRAREWESAARMRALLGNAQVQLGDYDSGYSLQYQALGVLRGYPGSLNLHNTLFALRNATLADGLPRTAIRIQEEAVINAHGSPAVYRAEVHLARARLHLAAGIGNVAADIAVAESIIRQMNAGEMQDYLRADLHDTQGAVWLPTHPAKAIVSLDSAVRFFDGVPHRHLPALFARAEAWLRLGRPDSAGADLERAMSILDVQRANIGSAQTRASLLETARRVFDQATMLNVRQGRAREALDNVERSRASFAPVERIEGWDERPLRTSRGQVGVEFALVGDTLLTWTLADTVLRLHRAVIDREALVRDVEGVRTAMELRTPEASYLPTLEKLYDQLIRPIQPRLGTGETTLAIVADGELTALPMNALRDRDRGRYLFQDHPIRFAGSLRDPVLEAVPPAAGTQFTLVADPAFDPRSFPGLRRLDGAAAEVAAIAPFYPGAQRLMAEQADTTALRSAFRAGGMAHFAGHAVFDDTRPERSFLVAAGQGGSGRLTAAEIEGMQLRGLQLVVLSACQTSRARAGRSGGFAGLAGAFLAAGAGGVVGSLWSVSDAQTRELMRRFHQAYSASGDAARALRQAQLEMLRSESAAQRSPAAWAGFRYVGG